MEKMAIFGIRTIYVNIWNAQLLVLYWEMGLATELPKEPVLNCICIMIDPQLNKIFLTFFSKYNIQEWQGSPLRCLEDKVI